MPFDEEPEHGGGGDDPRHSGIEELAAMLVKVSRQTAKREGKCANCTVEAMLLLIMGKRVFSIQRDYGDDEAIDDVLNFAEAVLALINIDGQFKREKINE